MSLSNHLNLQSINNISCDDVLNAIVKQLLGYVYLHPVKYYNIFTNFMFQPDDITDYLINICENDETQVENSGILQELNNLRNNWSYPILKNVKEVQLYSTQTGNEDPRGGGCGYYNLTESDFKWTISGSQSKEITLKDLIDGVYRLKGSKYDEYYESFCGLELERNENGVLIFKVEFDYGS